MDDEKTALLPVEIVKADLLKKNNFRYVLNGKLKNVIIRWEHE